MSAKRSVPAKALASLSSVRAKASPRLQCPICREPARDASRHRSNAEMVRRCAGRVRNAAGARSPLTEVVEGVVHPLDMPIRAYQSQRVTTRILFQYPEANHWNRLS